MCLCSIVVFNASSLDKICLKFEYDILFGCTGVRVSVCLSVLVSLSLTHAPTDNVGLTQREIIEFSFYSVYSSLLLNLGLRFNKLGLGASRAPSLGS